MIQDYKLIPLGFLPKAQRGGAWAQTMYGNLGSTGNLTQLLSTPEDQGYRQNLDNQRLYQSYEQQRLQQERFDAQQEQNLISNAYKEKLYAQNLKEQEYKQIKEMAGVAKTYRDELIGLNIDPGDQEAVNLEREKLKADFSKYDMGDPNQMREAMANMEKFMSSEAVTRAAEKSQTANIIQDKIDKYDTSLKAIEGDIKKRPYYDTMRAEAAQLQKELTTARTTGQGNYAEIMEKVNLLENKLNPLGQETIELSTEKAQLDNQSTKLDMNLKQLEYELDKFKVEEGLALKKEYDEGRLTNKEYELKLKEKLADIKAGKSGTSKSTAQPNAEAQKQARAQQLYQAKRIQDPTGDPGTQWNEAYQQATGKFKPSEEFS